MSNPVVWKNKTKKKKKKKKKKEIYFKISSAECFTQPAERNIRPSSYYNCRKIKKNKVHFLLGNVSKSCWVSCKQCRPWSDAQNAVSGPGLRCLVSPVRQNSEDKYGSVNSTVDETVPRVTSYDMAFIMKTRLLKYTENFTIKKWKFSNKKFWYFSYFCSKHRLRVLVRTASTGLF